MAEMRANSLFAFTASLANSLIASGAWARANSRSSAITGGAPRGIATLPLCERLSYWSRAHCCFSVFSVANLPDSPLKETSSTAAKSGPIAFAEAGVTPADIKYASIYDSFTITVIMQLEDLGFCAKGAGGKFVADGNLISGIGKLPFNTDGGGLCNNHPANRGSMTKVLEAVRQLRGEAHPAVQVKNCDLALAQGTGFQLATRHGSATMIMERE